MTGCIGVIVALAALAASAQDTAITGARISVVPRDEPVMRIRLQNRRDSPLVEVQIGLFMPGATRPTTLYTSKELLQPNAQRTIDVEFNETAVDRAAIMLAAFEDGYHEGAPTAVAGATSDGPGVSAVQIASQQRSTATVLLAAVENLRTTPIEALGFEVLKPGSGERSSRRTTDFCPLTPGENQRDHRYIQSHEIREFRLATAPPAGAPLPVARLTFVMFVDSSFEGRTAARDDLLRRRPASCGK